MKFTILITSYNKEKYLEECIQSCLNQNKNDYEIILCDNFSDGGTKAILTEFENKIKIIKKKKVSKHGPVNQMDLIKEGLNISKGDYICLLDGDDYFHSDKLKTLEKYLDTNKNLNIIFDLPEIKKDDELKQLKIKRKYQNNVWPTIINTSSITIKKNFLIEFFTKKLFENFDLLEIDFRLNVYSRCIDKKFLIIPDKMTVYRYVEGSIITSIKKFSKIWWVKRLQAHEYMSYIFKINNLHYKYSIDWFFSKVLSIFLK